MKTKRLTALTLTITLLASLFGAINVSAETEDIYTYTISSGEATITGCDASASGEIIIPSTLGGYPVTSIGSDAFQYCYSLTSVTIPDSVTSIGSDAFYNCRRLTSITIPDSVTSIGDYAFKCCERLTSITIPEGVTSIGSGAFYCCYSLTSVTIPDSVTSIGKYAFSDCDSLTNITIPDSVTSIGNRAFCDCDSLTDITIPNSVTSIGDYAFRDCDSLTSITVDKNNLEFSSIDGVLFNKGVDTLICCPIRKTGSYSMPDSVTSIGDSAFYNCYSLTSITIPDSVTSIGDSAFYNCKRLTSVTIPDSVTSIGSGAFYWTAFYNNDDNWEKGVLYINNRLIAAEMTISGNYDVKPGTKTIADYAFRDCDSLTSITIPDSVTSIGSGAFHNCKRLTSITIPDSVASIGGYVFSYCDSLTSITIPDSVTSIGDYAFYECISLTDVYYTGSESDWKKLKIGGFNAWLNVATIHYNSSQNSIGTSNSTSKGAPIINSATLNYSGKNYDILNSVANIEKDSDINTDLIVSVDNNGCKNVEVYLTQGSDTNVKVDNNITTSVKLGEIFSANKDIYILAVDTETGKSTSKKTRLRVVQGADGDLLPASGTDGLNFKLGKDTGFTIPDSVPVLGGTDINWSFDFIPISVEYDREDDNKINVVFGTSIVSEKYKDPTNTTENDRTYFKDFDFTEYKKDFKKAASKQGRTLKQLKNDFKMTNINKMSLLGGDILAGGKGGTNGDFSVAGYAEMKYVNGKWVFSEGQLALEAEISYTYQGQLFIWVVPVYYEFGGEVGAGIEGTMIDISPETFEPVFNAYLKAHLGANIGGGIGIAKVATVGASGAANFNIQTALHKEYLKSWVDGSANINVKVFGKEVAKKEFTKGEYLIYETGNNSGLIKDGGIMLMSANDMVNGIDINAVYKNESRNYTSNSSDWYGDDEKVSLFAIDYSNKNLNILAENVYTESAPQVCNIDGTKVMVMQWDNLERNAIDRTELRYSVYDDSTAKWSEPIAVYDDGTADFYPCFKDGYLVWQNQKTQLTDEMTLEDIAALGEICVAKWNGTGFNTPTTLTNNDTLETMPCVAVNGDNVQVLWVTNSENDITGITGTNSIVASDLEGVKLTLESDLGAISAISAGCVDGKFAVAYVEDEDNNLTTIEDRDITVIYNGETRKLTDNDILDSNPVFAGDKIYYYSDSNIVYTDIAGNNSQTIFDEATMGITDNFTVSQNAAGDVAVWWTKADMSGTNIYTAFNDGTEWNRDIAITTLENQTKYPSGILNDDGTMLVAFNYGILENNEIVQTDLYTVELTPSYDIEIVDSYIDEETMTIYTTVKNVGELPINGFELFVSDNGIVNNSVSYIDVLKPNDMAEVELVYNKPDNMSLRTLGLMTAISEDEYNTDNNTFAVSAGNADISVENIDILEGGVYTISADISNIGYNNADNVIVSLHEDSVDGEVVDSQVMSLEAGGSESVRFELNPDEIEFTDNRKQYYITAETDCDEITTGNNDGGVFAVLYEVEDFESEILNYNMIDGKTVINSIVRNNTDSKTKINAYTVVYDTNGKITGIDKIGFELDANDDIGVDTTIGHTIANGEIIKLFVWKDDLQPLASVAPYTVE